MKRAIARLLYLLCVHLVALAVLTPAAPRHWYSDKLWWAGTAVIGLSTALDAHSTCLGIAHGGYETNFFIAGTRSCATVGGFEAGAFVYWTGFHALEWHLTHDSGKFPRVFGLVVIPTAAAASHGSAAIHNYGLDRSYESPGIPAALRERLVRP